MAVVASVVYLARLLPQPIRTLRTGEVAGVSALAAINAAISDVAWLVYGVSASVPVVWIVAIPSVAFSLWASVLLRRTVTRSDVLAAVAWTALLVACGALGELTLALGATVLVTCGPQLWAAFRHHDPVGLSRSTWWIAIADAVTWGGYGLAIANRAIELYGAVLLVTSVAILVRLGLPEASRRRADLRP